MIIDPNDFRIELFNQMATAELGLGDQMVVYDASTGKPFRITLSQLDGVVGSGGGGGGAVSSVYGRTGDVVAATNDYTFAQIGSKPTTLSGYGITDAAASSHTHAASDITSGVIAAARLGTGSGGSTKFLREDGTWQTVSGGGDALTSGNLSQFAATTSAQLLGVISDETGTGALVFATSPTLVTPVLGTPASGNLSNCTALNASQLSSGTVPTARLGSGTANSTTFLRGDSTWQTISGGGDALTTNPLSQFAATTSAQLAGVMSDETGSGALVFATSPTLVTPLLGTPTSGNLSNCTALNATQLTTGTVPTARLGSGTASSTTVLYGDQTYKTLPTFVSGVVAFQNSLTPDTSGNAFWQPSSVNNSNDLAPTSQVLVFKNSGSALIASYADGVPVPANYAGTTTTTVTIGWRTTATSGNVVLNARYRAVADGESNDPSSWQESLASTVAAPGTARLLKYTTLTMTAANLAAGDTMMWMIGRDKSSGSDTLAADIEVVSVKVEY